MWLIQPSSIVPVIFQQKFQKILRYYHVRVKVPISLQQQQCVYVLFSFSDFKKSIYFASVKLQIHQNEVLLV